VGKRIAVTGGAGFIGKAVTDAAARAGHEVWPFDRAFGGDILGDLSGMRGADTVIHLAGVLGTAELFDDPDRAIDINVKGTLRVLQWCRDNRATFTGITLPPVFPSVYTATKMAADRLATAWHHAYGVPVSKVRAFNVYGPGQKWGPGHPQKFLPTFATKAWAGLPLPIWGDGTQTMDLISVHDLAEVLVQATDYGQDDTFDGGTRVPVTVNQFAAFVLQVTGSAGGVVYLPMRRGEVPSFICATGQGWPLLHHHPALDWADVEATIRWYQDKEPGGA
jgi:UDP-glucose 4-epimerase